MRLLSLILMSLVIISSCSSTKHTVMPYNGFALKTGERVLVRMLNDRYNYHPDLSHQTIEELQNCSGTLLAFEDVEDKLFTKLVVFEKKLIPDTATTTRLSEAINVDYLLTGGYLDSSKKGGLGVSFFNPEGEINNNGGWSELHFVLLNFHTNEIALKLIIKTKSGSMDLPDRNADGYVTTIHSSKRVKVKKAMKILSKTFHCN